MNILKLTCCKIFLKSMYHVIDKIAGINTIASQFAATVHLSECRLSKSNTKTSTGKTLATIHNPAVTDFPLLILKIAIPHQTRITMAVSHLNPKSHFFKFIFLCFTSKLLSDYQPRAERELQIRLFSFKSGNYFALNCKYWLCLSSRE